MKLLISIIVILTSITACKQISNVEVDINSDALERRKAIQYLKGEAFNGYLVNFNLEGKMLYKKGYKNGKREGVAMLWYANGTLKEERYYADNHKVGHHVGFFEDGSKRFDYHFKNDLPIETHKEWLENGQLYSLSTYNKKGQPEGEQKLYFASGKIRANYVIKNGRRFGLLGAKGCMGENEKSSFGLALAVKD